MTLARLVILMTLCLLIGTLLLPSAEAGPLLNCPIDCGLNGHCFDGECQCDNGFAGADCSFPYENCPDDVVQCYGSGALCVKDNSAAAGWGEDTGQDMNFIGRRPEYSCNCAAVPSATPFQIQECENPQSQHCEEGQALSEYAFCTNGGTCVSIVRRGEPHAGCHCPRDFEGRHCQYRKGTAPTYELTYTNSKSNHRGVDALIKTMIALVCLSLVWGFGYIVYNNYKKKHQKSVDAAVKEAESTEGDMTDLDLDDNGYDAEKRKSIEAETTTMESHDGARDDEEKKDDDMDVNNGEMA